MHDQRQRALVMPDGKQQVADTEKLTHFRVLQKIADAVPIILSLGEGSGPQRKSLDQRLRGVGEIAETETAGGPPFNRFNTHEKEPEHAGVVPDLCGPPLHPGR